MRRSGWWIAVAALAVAPSLWGQSDDLAEVPIRAFEVAGKVSMLQGAGGNIAASVGADGVLIVDDQFAVLAPKILAKIAEIGPGKLRLVLNTHWHGDHVGGNAVFGKDATIVAQENVRRRMQATAPPQALPMLTFDRDVTLHFNGEEIRVVHLAAGHTDGDSVVWFTDSNVVHTGDLFFAGHFPFVDLESGGTVDGFIAGVDAILARLPEGAKIIPGHGPLSARKDLEAYRTMLADSRDLVRAWKKRGLTLEQAKAEGMPDKYAGFAWEYMSAEGWIDTLWQSVK